MDDSTEKLWYALQIASGFEQQAAEILRDRISASVLADQFGKVVFPTERVVSMKNGKRHESTRKLYPSYIFIEMELSPETWHVVKSVPRVLGFVGGSNKDPVPLSQQEIDGIMNQMNDAAGQPKPRVIFENGEQVRVCEGPFSDFSGNVEAVNYERNRITVSVMVFGRATPVELDFNQVEKT